MSDRWASPSGDDAGRPPQPPPGGPPAYGQYGPPPGGGPPPPPGYGQYGWQGPPPAGSNDQYRGYAYGQGAPPPYPGGPAWAVAKPGVIPLRPLTLGDIYNGAMATIRGNPAATIGLSMILAVIVAVPTSLAMLGLRNSSATEQTADAVSLGVRSLGQLVSSFTSIILAGMLVAVLSEAVLGRRMSIGEAWRRARRHILSLIALPILIGLAIALAVVVIVVVITILSLAAPTAVTITVGILLAVALICGLILWYVRLMLAAPAVVLERCGPITAMKRSWRLSSRQFWRLLGISLLTSMVVGTATSVASAVFLIPTAAVSGGDLTTILPVTTALGLLLAGVVAPFQAHVTGLLYIDQRIRKEGLDVSLMAAATPQKNAGY